MKTPHTPSLRRALGVTLISAAFPVLAIGLGSPRGTVVMGRPLDIVIPVVGDEAAGLRTSCVQLLPAAGGADDHLPRVEVSLGKQGAQTVIRLQGSRDITSPILDFRVRLECGLAFEKEYTLLPDAYIAPVVETTAVAPVASTGPETLAPRAAASPVPTDPNALLIESDTSLRQLARQRYPNSAKRRVAFIRRMVAANPERFDDPRSAADTVLRAGEQLQRPRRPAPSATPVTPVPTPVAVAKPVPKPAPEPKPQPAVEPKPQEIPPPAPSKAAPAKPATGGDRLTIGSGGGSDKPGQKMSIGEATQAMDRMNELMNQQIQMQMEMTKQIGELHGQIEQLRSTLNAVQVEKQQVERKLEEERSSPSHYLQLIFAIIAGGLGGAGVLGWLSRRRNEEE